MRKIYAVALCLMLFATMTLAPMAALAETTVTPEDASAPAATTSTTADETVDAPADHAANEQGDGGSRRSSRSSPVQAPSPAV